MQQVKLQASSYRLPLNLDAYVARSTEWLPMPFILQRLLVATSIGAAVATILASSAHAQVILLSNLNSSAVGRSTSLNASGNGQFAPPNSKAAGFMMPANTSYTLNAVNLNLQFSDSTSSPFVAIYADDGLNNPGTLLTTLTNPAIDVGSGIFSFTPSSPFTLAAGTEYWIVANNQSTGQGSFFWLSSEPDAPTGIATSTGYRIGDYAPPPHDPSSVFNRYSVTGTALAAVPEASTTVSFGLLLALGLGSVIVAARKKRASASADFTEATS